MRISTLYILLLLTVLVSCNNPQKSNSSDTVKDTIPNIVMLIQKCSRLYTTEVHVHKIITHEDDKKIKGSFLGQDIDITLPASERKIAIPLDATLKAYIDFSHFTNRNITKKGTKIEIILPDPKIILTSSKINHQEIKKQVAFMRSNFTDAELSQFEQQGRAQIINQIPEQGIISSAQESAAKILIPMIQRMGYQESDIKITFRKQFTLHDIQILIDKSTVENGEAK